MTDRPYNDPDYRAAVANLKAHPNTPCSKGCGRAATTIDHDPPLALHQHRRGTRCCRLRPACAPCNYAGGAAITNGTAQALPLEQWWG